MTDLPQPPFLTGEYILTDPPHPYDPRYRYVGVVHPANSQCGAPVKHVGTYFTVIRDGVEVTIKPEPGKPLHIDLDAIHLSSEPVDIPSFTFADVLGGTIYADSNAIHLTDEGAKRYKEAVLKLMTKLFEQDLSIQRRLLPKRTFYRLRGKLKAQRKRTR